MMWQLLQAAPTCCASGVQVDDAATGSLSLYQSSESNDSLQTGHASVMLTCCMSSRFSSSVFPSWALICLAVSSGVCFCT